MLACTSAPAVVGNCSTTSPFTVETSTLSETVLQTYRFKITLDYGSAYHFRFLEHLPDDPYGPMVDRCARIAKYAGAGTVICTGEYRNQPGNPVAYVSIGSVPLRGFRNPEELFARSLVEVDSEEYLNPSSAR